MSDVTITAHANGPFVVAGPISLLDHEGNNMDLGGKETIALCRCGTTQNQPFCDGSHKTSGCPPRQEAAEESVSEDAS